MMEDKTGGSAFGRTPDYEAIRKYGTGPNTDTGGTGLTIRDYMAAAALQGIRSCSMANESAEVARLAYEDADAMLKERSK